jgi:hypothetical protein
MTDVQQRLHDDLRLRSSSPHAMRCYRRCVINFLQHCGTAPEHVGSEQVRAYHVGGRSRLVQGRAPGGAGSPARDMREGKFPGDDSWNPSLHCRCCGRACSSFIALVRLA